jgi:hypothetical protein
MAWQSYFPRKTVNSVEARQGFLDRPVLVVLVASLALVAVIFGLMLISVW